MNIDRFILHRILHHISINRNATKFLYWYFKLIKYLPCCNVRLISLKFISHNKLEWFQTSLNFIWFKCMMMVKPYTVCVNRMCLIKGASYELMSDGYVYSILDTIPFNEKRNPARTYFSTCARLLTKRKYSRMDHFFNARA